MVSPHISGSDVGAHRDAPGGGGAVVSVGESHAAPVAPEPTTIDSYAGSVVTCASGAKATGGACPSPTNRSVTVSSDITNAVVFDGRGGTRAAWPYIRRDGPNASTEVSLTQ